MKNIILDLHGVIYCHSSDFNREKSFEIFSEELEKYRNKFPKKYAEVTVKSNQGDESLSHEIEQDSIYKGVGDNKYLQLYILPDAIKKAKEIFVPENRVIIISSASIETIKVVLKKYSECAGVNISIPDKDLYDSAKYGSKKDTEMWKKIFKNYDNIDVIVEDKSANLEAAGLAANSLGFKPRLLSSLSEF